MTHLRPGLAIGIALFAGLLALPGLSGAAPGPDTDRLSAPPHPVASSHGVSLRANRGSYCWTRERPDGTGAGTCVDTAGGERTARRLPVHGGGRVLIDMRVRVRSLEATIRRFPRPGTGPPAQLIPVSVQPVTPNRRWWLARIPRGFDLERATGVLDLFARYRQGDSFFGLTLRSHRHS